MKRKAMALPVLLILLTILFLFAGAVTSLGTSGMNLARKEIESDRALYAADAGITIAAKKLYQDPAYQGTLKGKASDGTTYSVTVTPNQTSKVKKIGQVEVPPSTIFIAATGTTASGQSRESWALFRTGLGTVQVGLLADIVNAVNSNFVAYDSVSNTELSDRSIVASNNKTEASTITLDNSHITGNAMVGGNSGQVKQPNGGTVTQVGVLTKEIEIPDITVPEVPKVSQDGDDTPKSPRFTWRPPAANDARVVPPNNNAPFVLVEKNCMSVKFYSDGSFSARESGTNSEMKGSIYSQTPTSSKGQLQIVSINPFELKGGYHRVYLDLEGDKLGTDPNGIKWGAPNVKTSNLEPWVKEFFETEAALTNPSVLEPGGYGSIDINAGTTQLKENAVYVVKNLNVNSGGKLQIPEGAGNVSLYVTGTLTLDGVDSILNETKKPPGFKVYYTGSAPVIISGGANAYASLLAPFAPITLKGENSDFYGALIGRSLTIENAKFHYDTATNGVGTGTDGSPLLLLARYRP